MNEWTENFMMDIESNIFQNFSLIAIEKWAWGGIADSSVWGNICCKKLSL